MARTFGLWCVALFGLVGAACSSDSAPRCGDGELNGDETELSCCVDAGCESGVCDPEAMACVDPWVLACPAINGDCSAEQPYVCDGEIPSYDCGRCGCPTGDTCVEGSCVAEAAMAETRLSPFVPDDLPTAGYFAFIDHNAQAEALTYSQMREELSALLREDRRRNTILLGESHQSADEKNVGFQIIRDLVADGWKVPELGIEGATPIIDPEPLASLGISAHNFDGDLTNDVHCSDLAQFAGQGLNEEKLYIQYAGSGHTSEEACRHVEHWIICDPPHTNDCVERTGRKAVTIMLWDPTVWLWQTDRILWWRLPEISEPGFKAELDANIERWNQSMAGQPMDPAYEAEVNGETVNVRFAKGQFDKDVYIAYFPRQVRPAWMHESYRAMWDHADTGPLVREHNLHPKRCQFSWMLDPGAEVLTLRCTGQTQVLQVVVDGTNFSVSDWFIEPKPESRMSLPDFAGRSESLAAEQQTLLGF